MDDPPAPEHPTRPRLRISAFTWLLVAALVGPTLVGGALWLAAGSHQIVPGLRGCKFVRTRTPQINCYTRHIRSIVSEKGLQSTLRSIDKAAAVEPTLAADCHLAWHPIGESHGRRDADEDDDLTLPRTTTGVCEEGYAHGYVIGFLTSRRADDHDLKALLQRRCSESADPPAILNCVHSFGHVFARRADGRSRASEAIELCGTMQFEALPRGDASDVRDAYAFQCSYGAFMEIGLLDVKRGSLRKDNCRTAQVSKSAKIACYSYLSARVGSMSGSLRDGGRGCLLAPRGIYRNACIETFGQGFTDAKLCEVFLDGGDRDRCVRSIGASAFVPPGTRG